MESKNVDTLNGRLARWLEYSDGVNTLLGDRTEIGWFGVPERESSHLGVASAEYVPEHVHHNYKHTKAYENSKSRRKVEKATGVAPVGSYSNEFYW